MVECGCILKDLLAISHYDCLQGFTRAILITHQIICSPILFILCFCLGFSELIEILDLDFGFSIIPVAHINMVEVEVLAMVDVLGVLFELEIELNVASEDFQFVYVQQ